MTDDPQQPDPAQPDPDEPVEIAGAGIVNTSFAGTGALVVACAVGAIDPEGFGGLTAVVSVVCFVIGVGGFLWGYATGVVRSRDEQVGLGGLFFLSGTAPKVVRFRLRIAFAVQIVVAVAAASVRPYTSVAFAVLAPMLGLGMLSVWGARHGTFFPKDDR